MSEKILEVCDLSHRYGKKWAVKNVSFEIEKNGVLGLLGSNGAGKSTTINILCGVLSQTVGDVLIGGLDVRKNQIASKKLLGFLPQKAPLYPDLTVDEYLTHCAHFRLIERRQIKKAVEMVKERCSIAHFSKTLLRNLSGGYQQRVGIAQAIIHNPRLVVFDEPTNGLDPVQVLQVRKLIQEVSEERAVLMSTHILSEVQATCRDIIMIEQGDMVFSGSMASFNNYIEPNTLSLVMESPPTSEVFKQIKGLEEIDYQGDRIRIKTNSIDEFSKMIIAKSVEHNWGLKEIYPEKNSLDDIFSMLSNSKNSN